MATTYVTYTPRGHVRVSAGHYYAPGVNIPVCPITSILKNNKSLGVCWTYTYVIVRILPGMY